MDPAGSARHGRPPKKHHRVRTVIITIIAIIVVFLAITLPFVLALGDSLRKLDNEMTGLQQSYDSLAAQIESNDVDGALATAKSITSQTAVMKSEAEGWQWDVAAKIPGYENDVQSLHTLLDVSDTLANKAALPVVQSYRNVTDDGVIDEDGTFDLFVLAQHAQEIPDLVQTLKDAGAVVDECDQTVRNLPPARTPELADGIAKAEANLDDLNAAFKRVDAITSPQTMIDTALPLLESLL